MPSNPRPMSKLDGWAIRILAAERQGLHPSYVNEAIDHLAGKALPPMMDAALCREAAAINHRLSCDEGATASANQDIAELMAKFGLQERGYGRSMQPQWSERRP